MTTRRKPTTGLLLDLNPKGYYADGRAYYHFHTSLWTGIRLTQPQQTYEAALGEATRLALAWHNANPYSNLQSVCGVAANPEGAGYVGVYQTAYSST